MKTLILATFLICISGKLVAQFNKQCIPSQLMVAAENLNFRELPNINSKIIGILTNSEILNVLEVHYSQENTYRNIHEFSWIKVQRLQTKKIGYVFGKYLKTLETAYLDGSDSDRIQGGYWYGIYQEGEKIKIEKIIPEISKSRIRFNLTTKDGKKCKVLICSQNEIKQDKINGVLIEDDEEYLKIGTRKRLMSVGNNEFSIICTGRVELNPPTLIRKEEKVIFLITKIDGSKRSFIQQDLSDCLSKFGEVGYQIQFAGDLIGDDIPEIIISEGDTRTSSVYYFRSNKKGILELMSITTTSNKC